MHEDRLQIFAKRIDKLNKYIKALDEYRALRDLQFCVDRYDALRAYCDNTLAFCAKHKVLKQ